MAASDKKGAANSIHSVGNNFPGTKPGERLSAQNINRWIAGARGGRGSTGNGGTVQEPAMSVFCVNASSTVDIPYGAGVSLEEITDETEGGILNQRCFNVVLIESATRVPVVAGVAAEFIKAGGAGDVYIAGACLATVTPTQLSLLNLAGAGTIWDEGGSVSHYALVRFGATSIIPSLFNVLGTDVLTTITSTQFKGVGTSGTVPTSVPQADPAALTSFAACLGKARLGTRDTGTWVWIATQCNPGSGAVSDTLSSIPNDQAFLSRTTVQMPIAASSDFVTVYLPWDF